MEDMDFDELLERIIREKDQLPFSEEITPEATKENFRFNATIAGIMSCSTLVAGLLLRLPEQERTLDNCERYFQSAFRGYLSRIDLPPDEWVNSGAQLWIDAVREWFDYFQNWPSSS